MKKKIKAIFLFSTTKDQLNYLRFPIGEYLKSEIRKIANDLSIPVKDKPDSQDICFVTKDSYRDLINKLKPDSYKKGKILDFEGNVIGEHKGIINFTIGQRKGVGLGGYKQPLYVIKIDKEANSITLGEKKLLKRSIVKLKNINWLHYKKINNIKCFAKIRSNQKEVSGTLEFDLDSSKGKFIFDDMVEGTSAGQACVFYQKDQVLGGGWIIKSIN